MYFTLRLYHHTNQLLIHAFLMSQCTLTHLQIHHILSLLTTGPSTQTDVEVSAEGIDTTIEFVGEEDRITISFDITDDNIALENIESYVVGLMIVGNPQGVGIGMIPMTTVNIVDDDGEHIYYTVYTWISFL